MSMTPTGSRMDTKQQSPVILIVDDDDGVRSALERVLRRGGYEVLKAAGGAQALAALESHSEFSAIICDYWMPGGSSTDVLQAASIKCPDAARITMTGDAEPTTIMECLNNGLASHVILKPWDDAVLLQTVRAALALRQARLEHQQLKCQAVELGLAPPLTPAVDAVTTTAKATPTHQDVQRLEDTVQDLIALVAYLLDLQGSGSRGHNKRVAQLSGSLAEAQGLTVEETRQIETAALLKDLGQIAAGPQASAIQPADTTANERIQQMIGIQLLKKIAGFEEIANMVSGLHGVGVAEGAEKQLGSEILAVASTYDSQVFPSGESIVRRPNAAEFSLVELQGTQLSTELVDTFRAQVLPNYAAAVDGELEVRVNQLEPGMVLARDVLNVHSVPLLYAGSTLDQTDITSLKRNAEYNAVYSRIYISVSSVPMAADEPVLPPPPPPPASYIPKVKPADAPGPLGSASQKPLVVVIDDEQSVILALRRELVSSGFQVKGFTNPLEGLEYIRQGGNAFAVISDYMMPGIKGDRLLLEIQDVRPNLPCIVITGHATKETIANLAKSARPVRMLAKPWDKQQLLDTLSSFNKVKTS